MTPNFSVKNVKETVIFYMDILGFNLELLVPSNEKTIETALLENKSYTCAMMRKDEVFVMFLEETDLKKDIPQLKDLPHGASLLFYIDVEDIDTVYNSLKEKVEIVKNLEITWYGMKEFHIKDCNGYILGFGEKSQ